MFGIFISLMCFWLDREVKDITADIEIFDILIC